MRDAMLNRNAVGIPGPDAHRPVSLARHVPSIVHGFAVLDGATAHVPDDDTVPTVIREILGIAGVIRSDAADDTNVLGPQLVVAHLDPRAAVVMRVYPIDKAIAHAFRQHAAVAEPLDFHLSDGGTRGVA